MSAAHQHPQDMSQKSTINMSETEKHPREHDSIEEPMTQPPLKAGDTVIEPVDFDYPFHEENRILQRGDLILVRTADKDPNLYVFHHFAAPKTPAVAELYGFNVNDLLDLKNQSKDDLPLMRFRNEPNPELGLSILKKEILLPKLDYKDSIDGSVPLITLNEGDGYSIRPRAGAIRVLLLGECPFDCREEGYQFSSASQRSYDAFTKKFPDFLDTLSPGARELVMQKMTRTTLEILCPACHGYDLIREDMERESAQCKESQLPGTELDLGPPHIPFQYDEYALPKAEDVEHLFSAELHERSKWSLIALNMAREELGYCPLQHCWSEMNGAVHSHAFYACTDEEDRLSRERLANMTDEDWQASAASVEEYRNTTCTVCGLHPEDRETITWADCRHFVHRECIGCRMEEKECSVCAKTGVEEAIEKLHEASLV